VRTAPPAISVAGVKLSHPDKLYFPEAKITKRDLAQYMESMAPWILPHLKDRPLSLVRCPDGWTRQCFYQKHADASVSDAVARIEVPEGSGTAQYMGANSAKALVALVQWGVLEFHPWGARRPRLDRPDRLIFDFDPDEDVAWKEMVTAVGVLRARLQQLGLTPTGFRRREAGLHVVVPIRPDRSWRQARDFAKAVADVMARDSPDRFTTVAAKERRAGKIFIDYLRNATGATAVAPYTVRARANAPVATPIEWAELAKDVRFDHFNLRNTLTRVARGKDPWREFGSVRQGITAAHATQLGIDLRAAS
jgi:bifunctional non-homologous end joining protein LigD